MKERIEGRSRRN